MRVFVWMVDEVGGRLHPRSHAAGKATVPSTLAALDGPVEKIRPELEEDNVQELKAAPKGSVNEQSDKHDDVLQVWCTVLTHCGSCRYRVLYSCTVYLAAGMTYCTHTRCILLQVWRIVLILVHGVSYCRYDVLYSYTVYPTAGMTYCTRTRCIYILLQVWRTVLIHGVHAAGMVYFTHTRCLCCTYGALYSHTVFSAGTVYSYTFYCTHTCSCYYGVLCSHTVSCQLGTLHSFFISCRFLSSPQCCRRRWC
jgi:hypothetical protein